MIAPDVAKSFENQTEYNNENEDKSRKGGPLF